MTTRSALLLHESFKYSGVGVEGSGLWSLDLLGFTVRKLMTYGGPMQTSRGAGAGMGEWKLVVQTGRQGLQGRQELRTKAGAGVPFVFKSDKSRA